MKLTVAEQSPPSLLGPQSISRDTRGGLHGWARPLVISVRRNRLHTAPAQVRGRDSNVTRRCRSTGMRSSAYRQVDSIQRRGRSRNSDYIRIQQGRKKEETEANTRVQARNGFSLIRSRKHRLRCGWGPAIWTHMPRYSTDGRGPDAIRLGLGRGGDSSDGFPYRA
mgnify:CR=1 FL=1